VVVQYQSRGFLRGGTGDEYPIHALAARGFAVLSVQRPRFFGAGRARDFEELMRMHTKDFGERRRVLRSLETGLAKAVAAGWVDPARIGISGLSDGAATVQFALVNTNLFRAAALSSCCDEPSTSIFAAGMDYANLLIASGFPEPGVPDPGFWKLYSLAANARRLRTPILLQLTDDEFRLGLETFVTLDRHRVPVEMYVFADGYHLKWRPAHRLAGYERSIDWFDFWLNAKVDDDPTKEGQYARWRELARRQQH
jgi:dipeptidyl aminopeptidase/acylaminoacyl peptidase